MSNRFVVYATALVVWLAIEAPLGAQASTPGKTARSFTPHKTPWGDPDLQGVWPGTGLIGTPLQRDPSFGTRTTLTEQEFLERQKRRQAEDEFDNAEFVSEKTRCDPSIPDGRIPGVTRGGGGNNGYVSCG